MSNNGFATCPTCQGDNILSPDEQNPTEVCCDDCGHCWELKTGSTYRVFSFGVPSHNPELIAFLEAEQEKGRGKLSETIRAAIEYYMQDDKPPKWFEEWVKMVPQVVREVEQELEDEKVDLGGLFDD